MYHFLGSSTMGSRALLAHGDLIYTPTALQSIVSGTRVLVVKG